jgi:aryl-alcohol dehydrogenase
MGGCTCTIAAVVEEPGAPFALRTIEISDLRDDELLVAVAGVGICHTDIVAQHGAFGMAGPAVFGHEAAGVVEATGSAVRNFAVGDRVVVSFRSCGHCPQCLAGRPSYCHTMPALNYAGARPDGTSPLSDRGSHIAGNFFGQSSFAAYAVTYERNLARVPEGVPLELMGPLGCGIQTGAGAIMRSMACEAGSSLVIAGGGAVGLSAVMGARLMDVAEIVVIEPQASRRALAIELGATSAIDPMAGSVAQALEEIAPAGFDYALDTTGRSDSLANLLGCLAPRGLLGLIGISAPGTQLPADINTVMAAGHRIMGIIEGDSDPAVFIPELIAHHRAGRLPFDRLIQTYPLSHINEAIRDQAEGRVVKAVLLPQGPDPIEKTKQ